MKSKISHIFLIAIVSFAINSCSSDDEPSTPNLTGTYSGTFRVEYQNGESFSNPVEVSFMSENKYNSSGNDKYIPAGGSGTYEVNESIIEFKDINYWTANFDWNLILNGEYEYSLTGDQLTLSAHKNEMGLYIYELNKE